MPLTDLLISQLTDVFRIGLIIGLLATAYRTRANTGMVMPLVLGVVFIALMIPMTMAANGAEPLWRLASVGLVANLILLGLAALAWTLIRRLRS
jgi:uncharacterized membrane protein YeaQ/YmgE (transglycosylase-associated protein family)